MSHSPGPWHQHTSRGERIIVAGSSCVYVVTDSTTEDGYAGNGKGTPNPADVCLMAAAPDLLSALHYMVENAEGEGWSCLMLSDAVAAIAKAEGRGQ